MKGRYESSEPVRAKKHLGQHFLKDPQIASKIADTLSLEGYKHVLEIGPGTGVLTQFLIKKPISLEVIDLDRESIEYLRTTFVEEHQPKALTITEGDFLKKRFSQIFRWRSIRNYREFSLQHFYPDCLQDARVSRSDS